jgi:hypothetical protein
MSDRKYELHCFDWISESLLKVSFRTKTLFAGVSHLQVETVTIEVFQTRFGYEPKMPRKPNK